MDPESDGSCRENGALATLVFEFGFKVVHRAFMNNNPTDTFLQFEKGSTDTTLLEDTYQK